MAIWHTRDKDGTHRIKGSSNPRDEPSYQNIRADIDLENQYMVGETKLKHQGKLLDTKLSSIQVIRNGFTLDETEYHFDLENDSIVLNAPIQSTDTFLEIRSIPCNVPKTILKDVLILPVTKHLTKEMLENFIPDLGDEVSIERIESYQHNADIAVKMGAANFAEIIDSTVHEDGLYATVKFSIQQ